MGAGGCGSGFIHGLLGACGLPTYGINEWLRHSGARGSRDPKNLDCPKVIKHLGGFMENLNFHIDRYGWEVEHIFLAVASLDLQMHAYRRRKRGFSQEYYLDRYQTVLGKGMVQLIERDHPFTVVRCPRSIKDPEYCYEKLKVVLNGMPYEKFAEIHASRILPKYLQRLDRVTKDIPIY